MDQPKSAGNQSVTVTCTISFVIAFVGLFAQPYVENLPSAAHAAVRLITISAGLVFIVSLCLFGVQFAGASQQTLYSQTAHVLKRVALYVFLPAVVLSALLIGWAIITDQPTFRELRFW